MFAGKKTYLVAIGAIAYGVGSVLMGEMTLQEGITFFLSGAGLGAIRAALAKIEMAASDRK